MIRKTSNALILGPLTRYNWNKGPTLSIECHSADFGTLLAWNFSEKHSYSLMLPIFATPDYKSRIRARRYYRGN